MRNSRFDRWSQKPRKRGPRVEIRRWRYRDGRRRSRTDRRPRSLLLYFAPAAAATSSSRAFATTIRPMLSPKSSHSHPRRLAYGLSLMAFSFSAASSSAQSPHRSSVRRSSLMFGFSGCCHFFNRLILIHLLRRRREPRSYAPPSSHTQPARPSQPRKLLPACP